MISTISVAIEKLNTVISACEDENEKNVIEEAVSFLKQKVPNPSFKPFACSSCNNGVYFNRNGKWGCEKGCLDIDSCKANYNIGKRGNDE